MPAKRKVVKKEGTKLFAGTGVFGWMIIGIAIGGILVLLRYLVVSMALPADIYMIEPSLLVPGMAN